MSVQITPFERDLLLESPETGSLALALLRETLVLEGSADQLNDLREACSDLLQRIGFDEEYSPTKEGVALEGLIDKLFA